MPVTPPSPARPPLSFLPAILVALLLLLEAVRPGPLAGGTIMQLSSPTLSPDGPIPTRYT